MKSIEKIKNMVDKIIIFTRTQQSGRIRYILHPNTSKQECLDVLFKIKQMLKNYKFYDFDKQNKDNSVKYSVDIQSLNKRISFDLENKSYNFEEVNQLLNSIFYSIDKFIKENKGNL